MGGVQAYGTNLLTASVEFAYLKYRPDVFVIIADRSQLTDIALAHLHGVATMSRSMADVLSGKMVSALKALWQTDSSEVGTNAGRRAVIEAVASELNAFYMIENIIKSSKTLRDAMKSEGLEFHVAVLD